MFVYLILSNKMPVQNRRTRVKAPSILDLDNVPVKALSTNEKATLNLSGRVGFDITLEGFFY